MNRILTFIMLSIVTIACSSSNDEQLTTKVSEYLKVVGRPDLKFDNGRIFIVCPLFSGCHSCEKHILEFYKENNSMENIYYVFSMNSSSESLFRDLLREEFSGEMPDKFIIDFNNLAMKADMIFNESRIYHCGGSGIVESKPLTAANIEEELKKLKD